VADRIVHSPVLVLYMARCRRNTGKLLGARGLFQRLVSEPVAASAPAQWHEARADAERELAALAGHVPSVRVSLAGGAEGPDVAVLVDGVPFGRDALARALELDPGRHRFEAAGRDGRRAVVDVELGDGERERPVRLAFGPSPTVTASPAAPMPTPAEEPAGSGALVPGIVTLSVGGAGLVAGAVTGLLAISTADGVIEGCNGSACRPEDEADADRARALATASTVSFIAGGALVATGVVLLIVAPGDDPRPAVSVRAAPTGAVLGGWF
jgi:hypothetical protein